MTTASFFFFADRGGQQQGWHVLVAGILNMSRSPSFAFLTPTRTMYWILVMQNIPALIVCAWKIYLSRAFVMQNALFIQCPCALFNHSTHESVS